MGGVTARDPGFVAAPARARPGRGARGRAAGALLDLPHRRARPPCSSRPVPRTWRRRSGWRAEAGVPWFALGLGSNLLFPDEGLDALVIRLGKGLDRLERAGERWRLGRRASRRRSRRGARAEAGWAGLHKFVGVPGTVGGGVYMNAGCHGGEWADVVERCWWSTRTGQDAVLPRADDPVRLPPERPRRAAWCSRPTVAPPRGGRTGWHRGGAGGALPVAPGGHAVQPALLRQRLQEPGRRRLAAGRAAPHGGPARSRPPASRGTGSVARKSRRCTPTTS